MAGLPKPIGIGVTLVDIATGIGTAAKRLPDLSRSEVGAVAVKTAKVRIDFEMASIRATANSGVSLGIRTSSILGVGAGVTRASTRSTARSVGSIELEIVAIADVPQPANPPRPAPPRPKPPRPKPPRAKPSGRLVSVRGGIGGGAAGAGAAQDPKSALARAVAMLKSPQASTGLDRATTQKLKSAVAGIEAAMVARDFQKAARLLAAAAALFPSGHPFHQQRG